MKEETQGAPALTSDDADHCRKLLSAGTKIAPFFVQDVLSTVEENQRLRRALDQAVEVGNLHVGRDRANRLVIVSEQGDRYESHLVPELYEHLEGGRKEQAP